MNFSSPLRYPGGKGKLTEFVKLLIKQNSLMDGVYVEPYAGGASIAFSLLFQGYVSSIHLNDLNQSVYAFWSCVLNRTDALCKLIEDTDVNMEEWFRQKAIQKNAAQESLLDLGFSTFFLNRTNRSGIIKAGVIGGKAQTGNWKLDARFNKVDLIARIQRIARQRAHIRLHNLDAKDLITAVLPSLPSNTLVYLDPPYYVKGAGLYDSFYEHEDHAEIAQLVKSSIKQNWIVSYDAAVEIKKLYRHCPSITYGLNYSAQARYEGAEYMFFSDNLQIPEIQNPTNLRAA